MILPCLQEIRLKRTRLFISSFKQELDDAPQEKEKGMWAEEPGGSIPEVT